MPAGFSNAKPQDSDDPSIAAIANSLLKPRGHAPTPVMVMPDKIVHRTGRTIPGQFAGRMGAARNPGSLSPRLIIRCITALIQNTCSIMQLAP